MIAGLPGLSARLTGPGRLAQAMRSFSWMMAERMVSLTVALLVNIPLARYLGPENFGVFTYVLAVAALVGPLATLGLNHIVTKELVEAPEREGAILGTVAVLRKAGALVGTLCVVGWMFVSPPVDPHVPQYLLMIVGAGLIGSFSFLQFWFLSNNTMNAFSIANIGNVVFFSLIRLGQIFMGASLQAFVILAAIEILSGGTATYVAYRVARKTAIAWGWDAALAKRLLSRSLMLTLSGLTAAIYLKLDVIMLADIRSTAEAGIFGAAAKLSEIWYFVPVMLSTALFPALLDFKKQSAVVYHQRLQDLFDLLAAAGTVLAIVVALLSHQIVAVLFGPAFAGAAPILSIHIWSGVFIFMRALLSKWLIAEDLYVFSVVTHGGGAICAIVLNILLIPRFGGIGAAIATLLSYAVASYFSLLFHKKTIPVFVMMTRALFWPRRTLDVVRMLKQRSNRQGGV